jgi:nucleotidyltransferase/DNA polymerase involved in DNA repair
MPLRAAVRKCPEAILLPADNRAYDEASHEVMDLVRRFGYPTEVRGWDEAIIGARIDDPEGLAGELRAAVLRVTELSCSVGIGDTEERAKMATGFAKPKPLALRANNSNSRSCKPSPQTPHVPQAVRRILAVVATRRVDEPIRDGRLACARLS